jgi:ComF family protein
MYLMPQMLFWSDYTDTIRALIHRFKFEGENKLGIHLCDMALRIMADRLRGIKYDMVIPIPLRHNDKRQRGFNQSELIAAEVARMLGIPMKNDILQKSRHTKLQANLSAKNRWLNVKDVFAVRTEISLSGQSVLLVDDIVTTGATCVEASKALYDAGAEKILVFALACADTRKQAD